ncbi:hypothetical protein ONS95_005523 [Cadophora gregata]|uniref:uncharacterized protein n=1 Tax=Cadophora gregata TaxID=51156 RepID=UPI0026DBF802|nr:uncharacterized protein ONS95_005523 [Cadophora gregata]KAK0103502.1 hypothetical protein ONS95_005523 [Cadophora gregata]KAK0107694.1 hypothetical protein ONS96_003495 [Cadophora gregata f. sp. sojae]
MGLKIQNVNLEDFDIMINHANIYPPGDDLVGPPTPFFWSVISQMEAQERLQLHMTKQKSRFLGDRTATYLKVIDEQTQEIVSIARWHYYPNGFSFEDANGWEIHSPVEGQPFPKGMNIELHNFILTQRDLERKNWIVTGEPCWILMHLVTRSSQRGRGAAGLLIAWGINKAKADRVSVYLEAAQTAKPLYERHGFKQIGDLLKMDLRTHGVDMELAMVKMGILPPTVDH